MGGQLTKESKENSKRDQVVEVQSNKKVEVLLKSVPVLSQLTEEERLQLGQALIDVRFHKGEAIIKQGDDAKRFYILREGEVRVSHENEQKEVTEIAILKSGDYFGEAALLNPGTKRGATVTAIIDCACYALDQKSFIALLGPKGKVKFAKRRAVAADVAGKTVKPPVGSTKDKDEKIRGFLLNAVHQNLIFKDLEQAQRLAIVNEMFKTTIKAGESPIVQGDLGDNFYVVETGCFHVYVNDVKVMGEWARGACFGELALMYNAPRAATVTAAQDSVVWVVDRYTFRRVVTNLSRQRFQTYVQTLRKVELLAPLAEYEREKIAEALEEQDFKAGSYIFQQGEEGDAMYIVCKGEVTITVDGDEIAKCGEGQAFGERAILKGEPRAASVRALVDTSCLKLDRTAFIQLLGALEDIMKRQLDQYEHRPSKMSDDGLLHVEVRKASPSVYGAPEPVAFSDLKLIGTLGKGAFGHVQLVQDTKSGQAYALKTVPKALIVETGQQSHIMSEKNTMLLMKHPFIIRLFGTFRDEHRLFFLLEPCLGGDLFSVLRERNVFDEETAKFYAGCVISAFEYMHDRNIVYRDLKPENLLIDADGYLKVTDFGFAKDISSGRTWTLCGTPDYLAPEIVAGKGHGKGVDWWTVGVFIYEMLASYAPFYDEDPMKTYEKIVQGEITWPSSFSKEAKSIISKLLHRKNIKRLGVTKGGASAIKKHPWFKGFDWDALVEKKLKAPIIPVIKSNIDMSNIDEIADGQGKGQNQVFPAEVDLYRDDGTNWDTDFGAHTSK